MIGRWAGAWAVGFLDFEFLKLTLVEAAVEKLALAAVLKPAFYLATSNLEIHVGVFSSWIRKRLV